VLRDANNSDIARLSKAIGFATNNEAEYRALIEGLRLAKSRSAQHLLIRSDSRLVVQQILGQMKVHKTELKPLRKEATRLLGEFVAWDIEHIPREANHEADALADAALGFKPHSNRILTTIIARFDSRCKVCGHKTLKGNSLHKAQYQGEKQWVCDGCAHELAPHHQFEP
jgi:ribonuclease HI